MTKPIRPGQTSFDLFKRDLNTPAELEAEVASGKVEEKDEVPWRVFLGHVGVTLILLSLDVRSLTL